MSIAAIQRPSALYREEQNFPWWLYVLLGVMVLLCALAIVTPRVGAAEVPEARGFRVEVPAFLLVGLSLPSILVVGVLHMTTEVAAGECQISFGWVPTVRRRYALSQVVRVEQVCYRAIRDHGFWGVHHLKNGECVLTARGSSAVRLHLADGTRVLIGTQRPEELAAILERERRESA